MHVANADDSSTYYTEESELTDVTSEEDLGVWISADVKISKRCIYAFNKATRVLGMIKRQYDLRTLESIESI